MQYKTLGRTGLTVSRLGFGGIPIQRINQEETNSIFAVCRELGINFIDTARGYTDSEKKIGKAIAGNREQFYLASKSSRRDALGLRADLETCLSLLKIEYVDLYQLHMVSTMEVWDQVQGPGGAMEELLKAQQEGLIRFIGVTSHNNEVMQHMIEASVFDTAQFPLNVVESQFVGCLNSATGRNMGTIAMKPLAGGSFAKPSLALRYLFDKDITTAIVGMDSVAQVRENYAALLQGSLSAEESAELKVEARTLGSDFCRRCEYCLPCPQDVRIPQVFILEGYVSRYGLIDWARERYWSLPAQSDACEECGLCEDRCPYKLQIRDKLKKAHAKFEAAGR
ncbi:MAG: aldo/keto reductase [Bacillota bacterium]|nr:MAG: aldo/keto reductase [Bacillota bacterium]